MTQWAITAITATWRDFSYPFMLSFSALFSAYLSQWYYSRTWCCAPLYSLLDTEVYKWVICSPPLCSLSVFCCWLSASLLQVLIYLINFLQYHQEGQDRWEAGITHKGYLTWSNWRSASCRLFWAIKGIWTHECVHIIILFTIKNWCSMGMSVASSQLKDRVLTSQKYTPSERCLGMESKEQYHKSMVCFCARQWLTGLRFGKFL